MIVKVSLWMSLVSFQYQTWVVARLVSFQNPCSSNNSLDVKSVLLFMKRWASNPYIFVTFMSHLVMYSNL